MRNLGPSTVFLLTMGLLGSCSSYGPGTIERDRMDYGLSLNTSIQQQLLGNIVRLRYLEAPVFVNVASVINQYSLSGQVQAGVGFNNSTLAGNTGLVSAGGRWEDRPTITYTPISGQEFTRSLLTPLKPEALFALVQTGWSPEVVFRLAVRKINGIEDAHENPEFRKQADPRYRELLLVWTRLRQQRALGLKHYGDDAENATVVLYFSEKIEAQQQTQQDIKFLRKTLGLRDDVNEFKLSYGLVPDEQDEIAVLTASILDMMMDMSWQIDVPPQHVEEGRTESTFIDTGLGGRLFAVHYSQEEPENAFVTIANRGYWFYIDDRDMVSKRTFALLQVLLSLTDAGEEARGPMVSIGGN